MINHTLKLSLDPNKRHLVVGDIHGRYTTFLSLLDAANYDPTKDIVYSVGDLIDRGPDSVEVVNFFKQPNCYAVKGNHELMMMSSRWYLIWMNNGGDNCIASLGKHGKTHKWLYDQVDSMPWVIDVGEDDDDHAFRVVHAEFPSDWSEQQFQQVLDEADDPHDCEFGRLIWSRNLINKITHGAGDLIKFHPNRHRNVFVGHTPTDNIIHVGDHWFLDTWRSHTMSMIDAVTKQTFTVDV